MCRWDELPQNMQVKEVKRYYDILQRHKASLILKRLFDIIVKSERRLPRKVIPE